jgi:hypothetical protein
MKKVCIEKVMEIPQLCDLNYKISTRVGKNCLQFAIDERNDKEAKQYYGLAIVLSKCALELRDYMALWTTMKAHLGYWALDFFMDTKYGKVIQREYTNMYGRSSGNGFAMLYYNNFVE